MSEPETYDEALEALTEKQRAFVIAYAGNASEAARIAGYSSAGPAGCRLLKQSNIRRALALRDEHEAANAAQMAEERDVNTEQGVADGSDVAPEVWEAHGQRLDRANQLEHTRVTREQLERFLAGVVVGAVQEHGVSALGMAWSGPPKLKDRLKAAEMLAKMNHWNASDGGGAAREEHADPYGHRRLTRDELAERAKATARKLVLLQGGAVEEAG